MLWCTLQEFSIQNDSDFPALGGGGAGGAADGTGSAVTSADGDKGPGAAGVRHPWLLKCLQVVSAVE